MHTVAFLRYEEYAEGKEKVTPVFVRLNKNFLPSLLPQNTAESALKSIFFQVMQSPGRPGVGAEHFPSEAALGGMEVALPALAFISASGARTLPS